MSTIATAEVLRAGLLTPTLGIFCEDKISIHFSGKASKFKVDVRYKL